MFVVALGCADDGGGAGGESSAGTAADGDDTASAEAPDDADATADGGSSDDGNDSLCGNGVLDASEQCDDGDANSDTTPDACRTDCRMPQCSDGIIDVGMGEECDDGGNNANLKADACRTNCLLPRCGDGGVDTGEACDDGNEAWGDSCFECSARFYFILNAPDLNGGGNVSIVRTTRDGAPLQLVGGDPAYNGIWQIAVEPDGTTIYAIQSMDAVDRVLSFSGEDGAPQGEFDIGQAVLGYDPDARGIVRASDGMLYVLLDGGDTARVVAIDPAVGTPSEFADLGAGVEIADVTHDGADTIFIATGSGNSILSVDITSGAVATFATGLSNPTGLTYDPGSALLQTINNGGAVMSVDAAGAVTLFTTAEEDIGNPPAVAVDVGGVISVPITAQDRIAGVELLGGVQSLFTEMVDSPIDMEILELPDARD